MCHECIHLYETIMTKAPWSFMTKSPIDIVHFRGQKIHVKRDDMFHLEGNKVIHVAVLSIAMRILFYL
jgi:1-aminocyclopropane-1-carboxylate deaminase/D-cysteine desulfhydrase-like pyridoxal-dependent ACC family enzyme